MWPSFKERNVAPPTSKSDFCLFCFWIITIIRAHSPTYTTTLISGERISLECILFYLIVLLFLLLFDDKKNKLTPSPILSPLLYHTGCWPDMCVNCFGILLLILTMMWYKICKSSIQKEIVVHLNHTNVELSYKEDVMRGRSIRESHHYVVWCVILSKNCFDSFKHKNIPKTYQSSEPY